MKTINDINHEVAKELGLPLKVVEHANKVYWQEIRDEMENPTTDNVRIEGIGTFFISPRKTIKRVVAFYMVLRRMASGDYNIPEDTQGKILRGFKTFWGIKQKFKFRLTNKKWKYVNMNVGYKPYWWHQKELDREKETLVVDEPENICLDGQQLDKEQS